MTSFINCYEDITIDIARLHINDSPPIPPPKDYSKVRINLTNIIEHSALKGNAILQTPRPGVYEFSNYYDSIPLGFDIFGKVRFNHISKQIAVYGIVLKNGCPVHLQHRNQRIMMNHFLLKVNSIIKYGSFKINPLSGEVMITYNTFMTNFQYKNMLFDHEMCISYINQELLKVKFSLRIHWYKMMHLVNMLPLNYSEDPSFSKVKIMSIPTVVTNKLETLRKIFPYLHLEFPFMHANKPVGLKPEEIKKINSKIKNVSLQSKEINEEYVKIIRLFSPLKINLQIGESFDEAEKKLCISVLESPASSHREGEPAKIYSQINILASRNWEFIDQGGFGVISKGIVEVTYPPMNGPSMRRHIVRKEDQMPEKLKLVHEKMIIDKMRNSYSPFVAKFFYSEQEEFKKYLFIELCNNKSLSSFRSRYGEIMSMDTKLNVLKQVAHGMKFLKDKGICHLDIKPSNVLFGTNHIKITDFGESYHKDIAKGFRPGTSLPYAPPESFSSNETTFNDRMDVFSFGMLMYELIFDTFPFEYSRSKLDILRKRYAEKNYANYFILSPEKVETDGYRYVSQYLSMLALKCLDERDYRRPCIEWIIIYLHECANIMAILTF